MAKKIRLDSLLVSRGLVESRARAQAIILSGAVFSGETRLEKPGHQIALDLPIELRGLDKQWVSRGGKKLAHALNFFDVSVEDNVCIDIGCSTGGFTDVLLQNGAGHVIAVDVGRGQLDWKLRNDSRVTVLEGTNARYLEKADLPQLPSVIVCDASFISLKTVLPKVLSLALTNALLVALIKPQFEVGKENVGKGGVVRDSLLHSKVCDEVRSWLENVMAWHVLGITESPIEGPKGNKEFLICARRGGDVL
ncbi:MAG: TlyA family RNA methyltransferase [Rhodospirillaceae bacterium]